MNIARLPNCWREALAADFEEPWFQALESFVAAERQTAEVFPPGDDVFRALELTPLESVRVVILGQDPYHDRNQAHGLSFSVRDGVRLPPSLRNIFRERQDDLGLPSPSSGCLEPWAERGVLLLNTVLTVRAHAANSHRGQGWETFTDQVLVHVNALPFVVFVLWGKPAQKKQRLIDQRHHVIATPHPSPLSARRGFFDSRPFSRTNQALIDAGLQPIDWSLT